MIVDEIKKPGLYRYIHDENLLRQYDLLQSCVKVALETSSEVPDHKLLQDLNHTAVVMLSETAGRYRPHDVVINRSPHKPPPYADVGSLVNEFLQDLRQRWDREDAVWLAAFCLWRINWIHPFAEGNGRTARAVSYFVLCVKLGMWLPGSEIIPQQIRGNRAPYYKALRTADAAAKNGQFNVSEMQAYLEGLLTNQVSSD